MKKVIYYIGIGGLLWSCTQAGSTESTSLKEDGIFVSVETVKTASLKNDRQYSGTVEAKTSIPVSFQVAGQVKQIFVEEGARVKAGQALARVDETSMQSSYDAARAREKQAEDGYNRLKAVYDNGSLPEVKWVEMQADLQQARSMAILSKKSLDDCTLRAPQSGFVGSRNLEVGQSVMPGMSAFSVVKIDEVLVKIAVPENEIRFLAKGQAAQLKVSALGNASFTGNIDYVGVVADRFSRTYDAKISVKNHDFMLKPGMVCDVQIAIDETAQGLVVPAQAVTIDHDGKPFVYKVDQSAMSAAKTEIKINAYVGDLIEVTQGLAEGDKVVSSGMEKLNDKAKIKF